MRFTFSSVHKARKSPTRRAWEDTRTAKRLMALQSQFEKPVQVNLVTGITRFKKNLNKEAIYQAWLDKNWDKLMIEMKINSLPESFDDAFDSIAEGAGAAAEYAIESLPPQLNRELNFSTNNPRLQGFLRERTGNLIVNVTDDVQQLVQNSITNSFDKALTPRQVADQIVGSIGLYPKLQTALENYRTKLVEDGMDEDRVAELAGEYEDRLLNYRAMTVARTEIKSATNYAQLTVWETGMDQGLLDGATTRKVWVTDLEPCPICKPMDGKSVPLNGMWLLPTGELVDVPNESHPNCLCDMTVDFGDSQKNMADGLPDDED